MIPALLRLPATTLTGATVAELAALAGRLGEHATVLLGAQRTPGGEPLDEFVVAAGVASVLPGARLGVAARVGAGRAASLVAREATATQLLGGCSVLLLDGEPARCEDAATIIEALFCGGPRFVVTESERVDGARDHPVPDAPGGLPVLWCDGDVLVRLLDGEGATCGTVVRAGPGSLPEPAEGVLVVVEHPLVEPAGLAAAFGP